MENCSNTEYKKILQINPEELEVCAYEKQKYALETTNLMVRYENFNKAKRILKIAELIRELQKGEPRDEK